jgi:hypothetical protein
MTDELTSTFAGDGFLRPGSFAARDDVEHLHGAFDRLFAPGARIDEDDRVAPAGGGALAQVLNPERYVPGLLETATYRPAETLGHDAGANRTEEPRRAVIMMFSRPGQSSHSRATHPGTRTARDYGASISTWPSRTSTWYARTRVPSGSTHDRPSSSRNSHPCQGQRMTSVGSAT